MSQLAVDKELARLVKVYPLFDFKLYEYTGEPRLSVMYGRGSKGRMQFTSYGRLSPSDEATLSHQHMTESIGKALMAQYPDLYLSAFTDRNGIRIYAWVSRQFAGESRDSEVIGNIDLLDPLFHSTLHRWQDESCKAKQDDWFFCTGHVQAEPKREYGYFYFAGEYCKAWQSDHPEHAAMAAKERYN